MKFKTLPIFMVFLLMGVADAMGPLSDAVKTKFQLSSFIVPTVCFSYLLLLSLKGAQQNAI